MPIVLQGGSVFQGSNTILPKIWSNGKAGKWTFQGQSWDWNSMVFDGVKSSVTFVPDLINGGLQGDFSIGTGSTTSVYPNKVDTYNHTPIRYEIDPAGGTGSFQILSRELTYWHKVNPLIYSYQYTSVGNTMTFNPIDNGNGFIISYVSPYGKSVTFRYKTETKDVREFKVLQEVETNTTDDTTNSTYLVSKDDSYDLTLDYKIGANNTPESSYTDVWLIGFQNEKEEWEYFNTSYSYYKNVPWKHNNTYMDSARCSTTHSNIDNICLLQLWQKPNVLYSVHIKFINPNYTDYNNAPSASSVLESNTVTWNTRSADILIYVEFGVSPDGGKTIYWNGTESDSSIGGTIGAKLVAMGITSVVPTNINEYMTANVLNSSCIPNSSFDGYTSVPRYTTHIDTATVYGTKAFKFVRMQITTESDNDEANNIPSARYQHYSPINFEQMATATNAGQIGGQWYASYTNNSQSAVKFQIGRKYKTDAWSCNVQVKLNYIKDSLKYIGSTGN